MTILITGGAGYLGSILVPSLVSAGHNITVVDNFMYGEPVLLDCCVYPNFRIIRADVRDHGAISRLVSTQDVIIWLAAIVGAPACELRQRDAWDVNYEAVRNLTGVLGSGQLLLFPQSNSGYGTGGKGLCTEDSPLNPISVYGRSKNAAESHILFYHKNAVIFRFATLFGLSQRMRTDLLVNDFCYKAMNQRYVVLYQAQARRNFLHVRDAASAMIAAVNGVIRPSVYNCGLDSANLTKWQLCEKIKEHIPDFYFTEAPVGEDIDKRDYLVSNEKILSTGWRPSYSLDDGIEELKKGYEMLRTPRWANA